MNIFQKSINTPIGEMVACATENGICLLEFSNRKSLPIENNQIEKNFKAKISIGENQHLTQLENELKQYFAGVLKDFKVALDPVGTDFQKLVWQELLKIPYGESRSYKKQSISMNRPKSMRAVANANGKNKISIVIPCHRVIGEDGTLHGYGGGVDRKKFLLDLENAKYKIKH